MYSPFIVMQQDIELQVLVEELQKSRAKFEATLEKLQANLLGLANAKGSKKKNAVSKPASKQKLRVPLEYLAQVTGLTYGYVKHRTKDVENAERIIYPLICEAIQKAKAEFDNAVNLKGGNHV